ncbi:uncharacterized protein LOC124889237 [Capsicum annuum]|uniref:uncharacterized protein LOC124889237 n=1 Tax=Capsicum annuum TaxID=4072 RepID=UPI001FB09830|nr:uncharacterized protein LOC124889237 [Capsicum annuum]
MNLYATCLNLVQPSLHRRNQIKFGSKKWWEEKKGKSYGFGSQNELRRLRAGWVGIGSSRQVEAIDGVQLVALSQQITDLSRAFAQSVAQNEVMSKTVEELKKQVVSMSHHRHRSPSPDSSSKEETESDEFVDPTP